MVCVSVAALCLATFVSAQNLNWGISPGFNSASQLVRNPSKPEDGTFQFNSLQAWGLDAFAEKQLCQHVNVIVRTGYQQKGFQWDVQTIGTNLEMVNNNLKDKFHYINLDLVGKIHLNKSSLNPFILAGIRGDYLVAKDIDSFIYAPGSGYTDYSEYKKLDAGLVAGIGFSIRNTVSLALESNIDLIRPVKTETTAVRNWVWSLNMAININQLIAGQS